MNMRLHENKASSPHTGLSPTPSTTHNLVHPFHEKDIHMKSGARTNNTRSQYDTLHVPRIYVLSAGNIRVPQKWN